MPQYSQVYKCNEKQPKKARVGEAGKPINTIEIKKRYLNVIIYTSIVVPVTQIWYQRFLDLQSFAKHRAHKPAKN